jgi:hypothetical protein
MAIVRQFRVLHTDKVILRPSVTSSGNTRRKSKMAAWLSGLLLRALTTDAKTSSQSFIWMARMAKQTQSCTRIGFGPAA